METEAVEEMNPLKVTHSEVPELGFEPQHLGARVPALTSRFHSGPGRSCWCLKAAGRMLAGGGPRAVLLLTAERAISHSPKSIPGTPMRP